MTATRYWIIGLVQLGTGLLCIIFGGISDSFHGDTSHPDPNYYIMAYLAGGFAVAQFILSIILYRIGERDSVSCLRHVYVVMAVISCILCFSGLILTGLSGSVPERRLFL